MFNPYTTREQLNRVTEQAAARARIRSLESEREAEIAKAEKRFSRRVQAATLGMSPKTYKDLSASEAAVSALEKAGTNSPAYEPNNASVKFQVRMPVEWKRAVLDKAKEMKISQSELVRHALSKVLDPNVAENLPVVVIGRPIQ